MAGDEQDGLMVFGELVALCGRAYAYGTGDGVPEQTALDSFRKDLVTAGDHLVAAYKDADAVPREIAALSSWTLQHLATGDAHLQPLRDRWLERVSTAVGPITVSG
ncbi:MAG TPA: hypothetical protein VE466_16890 [Acidimicrobiales bacterium]|nr:hypothetical protein [Acidimicrobiales bacterium]